MILYRKYQVGGTAAENSDLTEALNIISTERKLPPDKLLKVLDYIAEVETRNKNIKQIGGGPGMGYYQYEPGAAKTAINRVKNFYKSHNKEVPAWVSKINTNDITSLTKEQQQFLALIDLNLKPNFSLSNAIKDKESFIKEWSKGWQTSQDPKKEENARQILKNYESSYDKPIVPPDPYQIMKNKMNLQYRGQAIAPTDQINTQNPYNPILIKIIR